MSYEEIGSAFVAHYYQTMAQSRDKLQELYADDSLMTFEGLQCQGKHAILDKITTLTFKCIQHKITSIDCQPVPCDNNSVIIMVMGQLKTDEDPPHSFTQTFFLRKSAGGYYIANEVFRMILHN